MKRQELISSKEYWSTTIALKLWKHHSNNNEDFDKWEKVAESIVDDEFISSMKEYASQHSELPSDEQCDEIAFRRLLLTNRDASSELQDRMLIIDGLQRMRSIASPLLASRDARIKELEEALIKKSFKENY